jgi:hypothetical protein
VHGGNEWTYGNVREDKLRTQSGSCICEAAIDLETCGTAEEAAERVWWSAQSSPQALKRKSIFSS